jgi:hypothetical protein
VLHAGRKPRSDSAGTTVKDLANAFLKTKQAAVDGGELAPRTWQDYKEARNLVLRDFRKGRLLEDTDPDDFAALRAKLARKWGP